MKLDVRPIIVESCALDGEGYMHRRGGQNMGVSRREPQTELGLYKTEKEREKVKFGLGLRDCEAGYETNNFGKLRVRWRGLLH